MRGAALLRVLERRAPSPGKPASHLRFPGAIFISDRGEQHKAIKMQTVKRTEHTEDSQCCQQRWAFTRCDAKFAQITIGDILDGDEIKRENSQGWGSFSPF